ncbi:MAG: sugar phosphate isomerase/epimerase [Verrucomicrobia bacterium]|nr:sugar phosphate isomerase/epimerase [Verrucomicrobiota bacterium]
MKTTNKLILTTIACLGLLTSVTRAADQTAAEKLGWKLGVQCWTFKKLTLFETLDKVHDLGLKYVEMFPGQKLKPGSESKTGPALTAAETAELQAKLKATGVQVASFGVAPIPAGEAAARKQFEWAKQMGIEVLVTETVPDATIDKLSGEFNIKVALHNHPTTWPAEKVLEATKDLSPRIGSCLDTGHVKRAGRDTIATIKQLGTRVIHSHFKDVMPVEGKPGKWEDAPWGTGQGNAAGMLAELKQLGFKGYFMIEYEHGTVDELMRDLPKCVAFFNQTAADLAK